MAIKKFRILSSREFAILEIDTNNLSDGMMFFRDPNFIGGMYTKENIDRFSIKPVLKFVLDEKGIVVLKEKII